MKLEYKSMFIGIVLGAISVFAIFFLFGDVEKTLMAPKTMPINILLYSNFI